MITKLVFIITTELQKSQHKPHTYRILQANPDKRTATEFAVALNVHF